MAEFKMRKFRNNDSGRIKIRGEILPGGKKIIFGIAGTDLSTMQFDETVFNFDEESNEIIKKFQNSETNHVFEYVPDFGFDEVDINRQKWPVFN